MSEKHFTVTAYVIEDERVLLIKHPKYNKWLPPGGHLEANETPPQGVKREVLEETGIDIALVPQENLHLNHFNAKSFERPYLCLLEEVPARHDSPAHQHMDLIYLAKPQGGKKIDDPLVRWFKLDEVLELKSDDEIFEETKQTIIHLLNHD